MGDTLSLTVKDEDVIHDDDLCSASLSISATLNNNNNNNNNNNSQNTHTQQNNLSESGENGDLEQNEGFIYVELPLQNSAGNDCGSIKLALSLTPN